MKAALIGMCFLCTVVMLNGGEIEEGRALFWPQFTVLQFSTAVAIPIEIPNQRVAMNWGLQVNYNLPFTLREFTNPIFWAARAIEVNTKAHAIAEKYGNSTRSKRDLTAGEVYSAIQDILAARGYHEDCLLKSVCELARHPLHQLDDNLLTEVFHFVLTPSEHQSFADDELHLKNIFESAEHCGAEGGDCDLAYSRCHRSFLDHITYMSDDYNEPNE